jgi:DNA-binding IscR family transcriptional regulator
LPSSAASARAGCVRGRREHLGTLWVALRAAVRSVLDDVTLAQVLSGDLPEQIQELLSSPARGGRAD